jgi:hypothetical protein
LDDKDTLEAKRDPTSSSKIPGAKVYQVKGKSLKRSLSKEINDNVIKTSTDSRLAVAENPLIE